MADWHVVVSGPVGVGKSTLTHALAVELGARYELESDGASNPFLADYYADPSRWAFHSQAFFLAEAFSAQEQVAAMPGGVVQDRHLHEHLAMFMAPKHEAGEMTDHEYQLLERLVHTAVAAVGAPDLLIYAHAPAEVVLKRIRGRGRGYEQGLTIEDVRAQLKRYERFVNDWKLSEVLRVDTSQVDVHRPADRARLAGRVRELLSLAP